MQVEPRLEEVKTVLAHKHARRVDRIAVRPPGDRLDRTVLSLLEDVVELPDVSVRVAQSQHSDAAPIRNAPVARGAELAVVPVADPDVALAVVSATVPTWQYTPVADACVEAIREGR